MHPYVTFGDTSPNVVPLLGEETASACSLLRDDDPEDDVDEDLRPGEDQGEDEDESHRVASHPEPVGEAGSHPGDHPAFFWAHQAGCLTHLSPNLGRFDLAYRDVRPSRGRPPLDSLNL